MLPVSLVVALPKTHPTTAIDSANVKFDKWMV
jgi:hypothetical protein